MNKLLILKAYESLTLGERFTLIDALLSDLKQYKDCLEYELDLDDVSSDISDTAIKLFKTL